ncbi:MAG: gliding motility-associated C-terminal domain-containing protein [Saprospiraceae bacterium]|nr:gliding motility-associated C-terminal domain-containing protein [Saprospiraceae bacterium]
MRKFFFVAVLSTLIFSGLSAQNLNIKYGTASVNASDTANIDVTVANFNNLFGMQFSINWDSTKFRFAAISNIISPQVLEGSLDIATPGASSPIKQGQTSCLWSNANTVSLPTNTRLFTLRLKAVGVECDSTRVFGSNTPTKSEYYNENFEVLPVSFTEGKAKINGTACTPGGGGGDDLTVTAPQLVTPPNVQLCIPIKVENFINMDGAQSKIKWDPTVLQMVLPIKYDALPGNQYNTSNIGSGEFNFVWLNPGSNPPLTIPNGERLMEICFNVIGPVGSMTIIDLVNTAPNGDLETEYTNSQGNSVPYVNIDGKVTVANVAQLKVTIADVTVKKDNEIDVAFRVENFIDITGVQMGITWDKNVLTFVNRNLDALPGNPAGSLDPSGDTYRFNWFNGTSPTTITNNGLLFNMRYKATGACDATSVINVSDLPNFTVEFINASAIKIPYTVDAGSVKITCTTPTIECNITGFKNVSCFGGSDGNITATVTNATADCQCIWKKDGVAFGNPLPVSACNLTNIPSGTYVLEVTCSGTVMCSKTATISQPAAAISVSGNVVNVGCGTLGSITLTVGGGTPNYTFAWAHGPNTKDLTQLNKGSYTVTVTDANLCSVSRSFDVGENPVEDVKINATVVNAKCFNEASGSISLSISGGCPDYTIVWANSTETGTSRANLAAGTYGVTVSDKSNPAKTASQLIVVGQPAAALTVTGLPTNSTGSNGAIDISVNGGTPDFTYQWSGNSTANTQDLTGLAPGMYTVVVTDANGCKATSTAFTITLITNPTDPSFTASVSSENTNSGYGVSCVNACDAVISGVVDATGKAPYTVTLSGAATGTKTLAAAGSFNFSGLCVGAYAVKLTDADNKTVTKNYTVTQPTIILISKSIDCSTEGQNEGAIDISVSGGAGGYSYAWSTGDNTQDFDNLEIGTYSVVVTDANGCQQSAPNLKVGNCDNTGTCYEEVRNIITPNGDGANDYFVISCAPDDENELFVYDRWGNLVYSQKNYDNLWDGNDLDGVALPESSYLWVINVVGSANQITSYKGTLTILREN